MQLLRLPSLLLTLLPLVLLLLLPSSAATSTSASLFIATIIATAISITLMRMTCMTTSEVAVAMLLGLAAELSGFELPQLPEPIRCLYRACLYRACAPTLCRLPQTRGKWPYALWKADFRLKRETWPFRHAEGACLFLGPYGVDGK